MKVILINSNKKEISEIDIDIKGNFENAYKLISCDMIEQISFVFKNRDSLLIDEEGRLKDKGFLQNEGFEIETDKGTFVIYGNALLVNFGDYLDDEEYSEPKTTINTLHEKVKFKCF
mgnify:CR=1 FL=1